MTKKDLEKRIIELEDLVNHQKRLIDVLYEFAPKGMQISYSPLIIDETCPLGGFHIYAEMTTAGLTCKCGKCAPIGFPPVTTSDNTGDKDITKTK